MANIGVLHLVPDKAAASQIVAAMIDASLDARRCEIIPDAPSGSVRIEDYRCLVVCWSRPGIASPELLALAQAASAAGTAVGVILDRDVEARGLPRMTAYTFPTSSRIWSRLWRFFAGRLYLNDIVAAAKFKLANEDPPPPSAPRKLLFRQAWVGVVGLSGLIAVIANLPTLHSLIPWPRFNEEEAWGVLRPGSCSDLAVFRQQYPVGKHAEEAAEIIDRAQLNTGIRWTPAVRSTSLVLGLDSVEGQSSEVAARRDLETRAKRDALAICRSRESTGARFLSADYELGEINCHSFSSGIVCTALNAKSICSIQEPGDDPENSCWKKADKPT